MPPAPRATRRSIPPGFALESFDVIGGFRERYRSIGDGDPAPRGAIDPFIGISFKLGPPVDPSGALPDGRKFHDIRELQSLLAANPERLLRDLAEQLAIYATGRELAFSDRDANHRHRHARGAARRRHPHAAARTRAERIVSNAMTIIVPG